MGQPHVYFVVFTLWLPSCLYLEPPSHTIYKSSVTQDLPPDTNLSLMSSGRGGFQVGSGCKQKIPEESAEAEDGVQ